MLHDFRILVKGEDFIKTNIDNKKQFKIQKLSEIRDKFSNP